MMKQEKPMAKEKCDDHTGCVNQITTNKENIIKIFELVEKVRNRLPNWATLLISVLTLLIGWLLSRVV